jgi:glutamyl-Q tRNA(Asp) synthetase
MAMNISAGNDATNFFVTRFAPSPTGRLHLGHAASAFRVWQQADAAGGTVLLRIEDIDATRCHAAFDAAILEDLHWLGLAWPEPVRRQSQHLDAYARLIADLAARGLVYRCFRTRAEVAAEADRAPHGPEPVFRGRRLDPGDEAARLEAGKTHAWRLDVDAARSALGAQAETLAYTETGQGPPQTRRIDTNAISDVVLARKDTPTSYHLAACHDDALQGVTHVIRGEDLADCTPVHTLLQAVLGWPQPTYHHHPLVVDDAGRRLAKRDRSMTIATLREKGVTPGEIRRMAGLE